jgi:RNA polymerase sigma-70 factor (ECF subfamily)
VPAPNGWYDASVTDSRAGEDPSAPLLRRWQQDGDVDALDELLRIEVQDLAARLRNRGRGLLRPSTSASDLAQEATLRLLRLEEAPEFKEPRELRAYLWTAAWRLLLNRGRARGRSAMPLSRAPSGDLGLMLAGGGGVSEAERSEQHAALNVVMNLLRDEDREVLVLVYFQHKDIEAVAKELGVQRAAAEMRLSRARRRLAEKMVGWSDIVT